MFNSPRDLSELILFFKIVLVWLEISLRILWLVGLALS